MNKYILNIMIFIFFIFFTFSPFSSKGVFAEEDGTVLFNESFTTSVAAFVPTAVPSGISSYPAWSFHSPHLSLNQSCTVKAASSYLSFTKNQAPPLTNLWDETLVARRSFNTDSPLPAELTGKYTLEFTVSSQNSSNEGMYFRIQNNKNLTLIDGFVNNSRKIVELTDGTSGRQTESSTPVPMPQKTTFGTDTVLKFEIDTRLGSFRYYQSNIDGGAAAVPGRNGELDRSFAISDGAEFNLGSIYFAPRNNVPVNHVWRVKNITFIKNDDSSEFLIKETKFYKDTTDTEISFAGINEYFRKLLAVTNVFNKSDERESISGVMAFYNQANILEKISFKKFWLEPLQNENITMEINDISFSDKKDNLKLFFWKDSSSIQPLSAVKTFDISDVYIILERLQSEIYSSTVNPSVNMDDLKSGGTFSSVNYNTDTSTAFGPANALDKIKVLVQAYMSPDNEYYQNQLLKEKIDSALTDWAVKDYKCASNWWFNDISVPQKMTDILIFNLPEDSRYTQKLYQIAKRGLPVLKSGSLRESADTGANLTDKLLTTIKIGAATRDPSIIKKYVTNLLEGELKIFASPNEGIMADGSFQQHSALFHNGSYGIVFVSGVNSLLSSLAGTEFMVSERAVNIYCDFILDGHQYMFRNNTFDPGSGGRSVSRENSVGAGLKNGVIKAVQLLLSLPEANRKTELEHLKNTRLGNTDNQTTFAKHFWNSDFTVIHRPDFYAGIRSSSTRTKKTEYMNGENSKGYFLADGATIIMRDGTEYTNIYPVWDWNKIPGTTTVQAAAIPTPASENGGDSFVGGVSDGRFAVSAMNLKNNGSTTKLNARKAWFLFDEGFMAMGSGITTTLSREVVTSLNQTLLNGDVLYKNSSINTLGLNSTEQLSDVSWVLHNNIGYIFNGNQNVTISNKKQSGKWTNINSSQSNSALIEKDIFGLYLSHGAAPSEGTYSYTVLPNVSQSAIEVYTTEPNMIEIDNSSLQASVWNKSEQALGAVFWSGGTVNISEDLTSFPEELTVSADKPCVILLKNEGDSWKISASNPNNAAISLKLTINRSLEGDGVVFDNGYTAVTFDLPGGIYAGSTKTVILIEK